MSRSYPTQLSHFRPPPIFRPGDRIRIVSPCGAVKPERLAAGLAWIEAAGFVPVYDDALFATAPYLAGPDAQRLAAFREALHDPDARAIWVARGGYGATRLLPGLDVETVARACKGLVGFSDVTALHALWLRAGLRPLHGPCVSTLEEWAHASRDALLAWLTTDSGPSVPGRLVGGRAGAEGPIVGGNLAVLAALAGTGFLPPTSGCLLLLEDLDEAPYRLDRCLTQLRQAGALDGVKGVVVGQLTDCGASYDEALQAVLSGLGDFSGPVLTHVAVGHEPDSVPVPLGRTARIDAGGLHWTGGPAAG